MASQVRPLILLVATAAASFGWQAFDDKPRAGAAFSYLLALVSYAVIKHYATRLADILLGLVCTFGVWISFAGLACVLWAERLTSRDVCVCDEATGAPVRLLFGVGLLIVTAEFLGSKR